MAQSYISNRGAQRKQKIQALSNEVAKSRARWTEQNRYYYDEDMKYYRFLIPEGSRVLHLGCGTGDLLEALNPSYGIGVDFSEKKVEIASQGIHENTTYLCSDIEEPGFIASLKEKGPFDFVILSLGYLEDCEAVLDALHTVFDRDTRLIIGYYSWFWGPLIRLSELLGMHIPQIEINRFTTGDINNLLNVSGFDTVKVEWRQLLPLRLFGLGPLVNRFLGTLPFVRKLCLRNYIVARSERHARQEPLSCTVLVPCRNEKGNIEAAVKRLPRFCDDLEIMFVEGNSQDDTYQECLRVQKAYPQYDISVYQQDGKGKGDAVRKGFDNAKGEVLMILDADLTTPPETMPKFYEALVEGKGEFINGTRLVYPLENEAMRFLNYWANRTFSKIFTFLLNQRFTDTLCGTKVLTKTHYDRIVANRHYFGDFDPFGDFDLIFGAAKINLKIVEIPIRYAARDYGETQISRFRHGVLLLKMVVFAFRKLKAF